jgi:hypothetical protein
MTAKLNSNLMWEAVLSPKEFLGLTAEQRAAIEHLEPIPAKLGSNSFGKFRVTFLSPVYAREDVGRGR